MLNPQGVGTLVEGKHLFPILHIGSATPKWGKQAKVAVHIRDLARSIIGARQGAATSSELIAALRNDPRLSSLNEGLLESHLKAAVAGGVFRVHVDARSSVKLELTQDGQEHESVRKFVASFGSELTALSNRVASIVQHGPSIGTYREVLLKELLRNHLPTRYDIATGFIFGCSRQLDVLIYDQQDFAPIFRQGSMVVVPLESVRAVIEVKSRLTKKSLRESLDLLNDVPDAHVFGSGPPMFKGIFAFASSMSDEQLRTEVADFYIPTDEADLLEFHEIGNPYSHLTSLCVHESAYLFTSYRRNNEKKVRPVVQSVKSLTDLAPQSGLFWTRLSAYLRKAPITGLSFDVERILGADIYVNGNTPIATDDWGPYGMHKILCSDETETSVLKAERLVERVEHWLAGEEW
ncbi:DUF6602 domain-containing protein [Burkholderia sp. HI2500]|uniref:DUF6602 domain-containing protein n=1 Tax=Burkholderia sp. HI2500 TaxID=2015358 RepID=UPI00117C0C16|nr:DUF6602 domain-containing protein [Burkholderia sp. HI2500]